MKLEMKNLDGTILTFKPLTKSKLSYDNTSWFRKIYDKLLGPKFIYVGIDKKRNVPSYKIIHPWWKAMFYVWSREMGT